MGMFYRRNTKDKNGNIKEGKIQWIKYYRNGKVYDESTGTTKRRKTEAILKDREGDMAKRKLPPANFNRMKYDELAEDLKKDYKPRTCYAETHVKPWGKEKSSKG